MNKIIKKALSEFADMQLNLKSEVAQECVATKINEALLKEIEKRTEVKNNSELVPEDVIRQAMEQNGFEAGDSGYEFAHGIRDHGIRDIDFHKNGNTYVVTIQEREDEDTLGPEHD
jgi:hypothetical protein